MQSASLITSACNCGQQSRLTPCISGVFNARCMVCILFPEINSMCIMTPDIMKHGSNCSLVALEQHWSPVLLHHYWRSTAVCNLSVIELSVTEESGRALGVLSGTLPEAHEGVHRKETPIVTRVRCVFGHTATHGFGGIPWYRTTEIHGRILRPAPLSAEGTDGLDLIQNVIQVSSEERMQKTDGRDDR